MLSSATTKIFRQAADQHLTLGTVLDVGPGTAWLGLEWLKRYPEGNAIGVGYPAAQREEAGRRAEGLGVAGRAEFLDTQGWPWPLPDKSVDGVMAFGGLSAWPEPLAVLAEIRRVLKTGGKFFIGDIRSDAPWLATALAALLPHGFQEVYRRRDRARSLEEIKDLCAASHLPRAGVHILGAEVWITSANGG